MTTEPTYDEIESLVKFLGTRRNPKWSSHISGYDTFHEDQKDFLREEARDILEFLYNRDAEMETLKVGDHVIYDQELRGWWAPIGAVLEGPNGETVYYLTNQGYGKQKAGRKYYRYELEKLPPVEQKFYPGDIAYLDMKNIDPYDRNGWSVDDYVEVIIESAHMTIGREYRYKVRPIVMPENSKPPKRVHFKNHQLKEI